MSLKLTPAAATSTSSWPGPGLGVGQSLACRTSGPPWSSTTTARIQPSLRTRNCTFSMITEYSRCSVSGMFRDHGIGLVAVDAGGRDEDGSAPLLGHDLVEGGPVIVRATGRLEDLAQQQP